MSVLTDLATLLQTEGVGTVDTDIFRGRLPDSPNQCLSLQTYPGDPPRMLDDDNQPADEYDSVQVIARAEYQGPAETLAMSAYRAITFRHKTLTSGDKYGWCRANQKPAYLGVDENNRHLVSFNVRTRRLRAP